MIRHLHPVYPAHCGALTDTGNTYCTNDKDVNCPVCLDAMSRMTTKFSFPRSNFVDKNGLFLQLEHIESEFKELLHAYFNEPLPRVAEEATDLKHSVETLQRILMEKSDINIAEVEKQVIEKNRERGYYD